MESLRSADGDVAQHEVAVDKVGLQVQAEAEVEAGGSPALPYLNLVIGPDGDEHLSITVRYRSTNLV